jgi:hypothetical protein
MSPGACSRSWPTRLGRRPGENGWPSVLREQRGPRDRVGKRRGTTERARLAVL